jgi:hypothetical protein
MSAGGLTRASHVEAVLTSIHCLAPHHTIFVGVAADVRCVPSPR